MSYYDNQKSKVNIMFELEKRGWNIFGFKADESDMMVDYWSPAHWSGIAEKNGHILLVDVHYMGDSGKKITKQGYAVDHSKITKLQTLADDPAASVGERENSLRKIEEMKQKAKESEIIVSQYPSYANINPSRNNWHVEKDGVIIAKGNGAFKCHNFNDKEAETKAIITFVDRVEKSISNKKQVSKKIVSTTEVLIKAVPTEDGEIEKDQLVQLNVNFTYGCNKGVFQLYYVGQNILYFGRMNKKLNKMMSTNTRGNQLTLTVDEFNKYLEKGSISFIELKEVEVEIEKTVYVESDREENEDVSEDALMIEGENESDNEEEVTVIEDINHSPSVSYSQNEELNGIEIRFETKPDQNIIDSLKANGFRWSKRGSFWYAKQSPERLAFVKNLTGEDNLSPSSSSIEFSYPNIDIEDIDTYTIDESLQRAEHDANWIFRSTERDHTKEIREYFATYNDKVKKVLSTTDSERITYHLKTALQRFKKKYHTNTIDRLRNRANNPNWAVTGRGNLNLSRYNKAQDRYNKLIEEGMQIAKDMDGKIEKARSEIRKEKEAAIQSKMKSTIVTDEFKIETKTIIFNGLTESLRTYNYGEYMIAKTWGCFRIFKNGKHIHGMRSKDKLEDAKRYVLLLSRGEIA